MSTGDTTGSWWEQRWAYVVLPVDGEPVMRRFPGHPADVAALVAAIREEVPDLGTQGVSGGVRLWFMDNFLSEGLPPNPLADLVVPELGYELPHGWRGPVVISHETGGEGDPLPLPPETVAVVSECAAQLRADRAKGRTS